MVVEEVSSGADGWRWRSRWTTAAAALAVIAIIAVAILSSGALSPTPKGTQGGSTTCTDCFIQEPVVDIIMPALGSLGNSSNPNRVVAMTAGTSRTFEVDIYPTIGTNFTMGFSALLIAAAGASPPVGSVTASFQPTHLELGPNQKGVTLMTVVVPNSTSTGSYDAVVSATDLANGSYVWGLYFQIVVGGP